MRQGLNKGTDAGLEKGSSSGIGKGNFRGINKDGFSVHELYSNSIQLNGISDYMQATGGVGTALIKSVVAGAGKSFSTRFIFKCNSFANTPFLYSISNVAATQGGVYMLTNAAGKLNTFIVYKNSANFLSASNGPTFTVGQWYDVIFIYDSSNTSHILRPSLYVNGILQTSITWVETGTVDFIQDTTTGVAYQWGFGNSGANFFNGLFQEAGTYWSVVLGQSEISKLYNNGILTYSNTVEPGNLVCFCPADLATLNNANSLVEITDPKNGKIFQSVAP
jgi:hypothetical protein